MIKVDVQQIKQRFGIIGNNAGLNRAIDVALQVAPTDLSVLITGESGVGKETFPQIIHQNSPRKHGQYIAVTVVPFLKVRLTRNCSDTKKVLLQERCLTVKAISRLRMAGRSSWMK